MTKEKRKININYKNNRLYGKIVSFELSVIHPEMLENFTCRRSEGARSCFGIFLKANSSGENQKKAHYAAYPKGGRCCLGNQEIANSSGGKPE